MKLGSMKEVMILSPMRVVMGFMKKGTGEVFISVDCSSVYFPSLFSRTLSIGKRGNLLVATKYNNKNNIKLPSA